MSRPDPTTQSAESRHGRPLVLDAFCAQGGAGRGFYDAGFDVLGVDIEPQPRYPFEFIQEDALWVLQVLWQGGRVGNYGLEDFAAFHASPPCQRYSDTQRLMGNEHPDLIGPTREALIRTRRPYVIENVMGAKNDLQNPVMLCGAMFPALRVYRHRLFESNFPILTPGHPEHVHPQVKMGRAPASGEWVQAVGNFSGVQEARDAMDCQWMSRDGLRECIPPAYAEWVGHQLLAHLRMAEMTHAEAA